jgi:uncharacterized glyoxalase superfamily protein PhnB
MSQTRQQGSTVIPCLMYRDAPKMIDWLCRNLGFNRKAVYPADDGSIMHAELTLGAGMLMLGSVKQGDQGEWGKLVRQPDQVGGIETQTPAVNVADPDTVYARVKADGGTILIDIEDKGHGGRGFTFRDPEGHIWAIGSYDPWS